MLKPLDEAVASSQKKRLGRDLWIVWVPLMVIAIYLFGFASEKYSSSASYRILDNSAKKSASLDLGFLGFGGSLGAHDEGVLEAYLRSMDALVAVDKKFGLKDLYHSDALDLLHRMNGFSSSEDYLERYRQNIGLVTDELSGLTTLSFLDTDRERATEVVRFLLKLGGHFLNDLNRRNAERQMAFMSDQMTANKAKLDAYIEKLEGFQKEYGVIDPRTDMEVQFAIIATLEKSVVEKNARLNQLRTFMSEDAIDIVRLVGEIDEMKAALGRARTKLTGEESQRINELIYRYEAIKADVDFAREVYKQTLVQYEVRRIGALQEAKILEVITTPSIPDDYSRPEKMKLMMTALILLLLISRISRLIFAVIEDHKD